MAFRYAQVEELHENYEKHPQNGIKECERRLKRNPGNLASTLALARFLQDLNRDGEAIATLEKIKSPGPNVDPEILSGIQETIAHSRRAIADKQLRKSEGGSFLLDLWSHAIERANKQRKKTYRQHMFKAAVRDRYWDLAQQVFVWLQKEYPSNTYYHFMWILFTHLRATACQTEFPEDHTAGQLFGTLAFRSLDAAVANTLNKKDTSKRIQSVKELRLLIHVYEDQGRYEELLKVLNNPMIGIDSELAKGDDSFKRLRLDILVKLQKEKEVYDLCFSSLNTLLEAMHSSTGDVPLDLVWIDDLDIWTFLIDAADGEDNPDSWSQIHAIDALIQRFLTKQPSSRNAAVAALYHASVFGTTSELLTECSRFFYRQCSRPSCFDDLREYVEDFDTEEQEVFLDTARHWLRQGGADSSGSFDNWVMSEINLLKLTYLLCFSKGNEPRPNETNGTGSDMTDEPEPNNIYAPKPNEILNFIRDCLCLFDFCRDRGIESGNDAALLAAAAEFRMMPSGAIGLLRGDGSLPDASDFETQDVTKSSLVQAVVILEYLSEEEPFNYSVLLLLLRAYLLLGLGSLAMAALNKLNLKEVQNETAKHLFYTRISTIHPFQAGDEQPKNLPKHIKDPLLGCMDIQPWYSRASRQLVESISGDLDDIPLHKVVEYVEFKDSLEQSIARVMYQIEQRRMARLRDQTPLLGPPLLYTLEKDLVDNRYFTVLPDFQHSMSPSFAELSSAGPLPQRIWIAASTRADLVQTLIQSRNAPSPSQIEHIMASEDAIDLGLKSGKAKLELTAIESRFLIQEWKLIGHLLIDLLLSPNERLDVAKLAPEKHLEIFNHMRSDLTYPLDSVYGDRDLPMWTLLHFSFTELERLKAWEQVCGIWIATKKKDGKHGRLPKQPSVEQINALKEEIRRRAVTLQNEVRAWKIRLEKTGTERILEMMKRESNLEQILGAERLKRYARSMRDSAVDALDGVIKVKVGW